MQGTKIVIVGVGSVGSTLSYTLINQDLCDELVLIDRNTDKVKGEVLDMRDSVYYLNRNIEINCGTYQDCKDANIVVITASAPMRPGLEDRNEMLKSSKILMEDIINNIMASGFNGILLIVSNPVDLMTYHAWRLSGLPARRVLGTGTTVDTARLCSKVASVFSIDSRDISALVLGEHGDSEFIPWSTATIGGKTIEDVFIDNKDRVPYESFDELRNEVKKAGWEIFKRKGNTSYGIASSTAAIIKSILFNENRIYPVSTYLTGQYGVEDVYISVPTVIDRNGAREIVEIKLKPEEEKQMHASAELIKSLHHYLRHGE